MNEGYVQLPLPGFEEFVPEVKQEEERNWGILHQYNNSYDENTEWYTREEFFSMIEREGKIMSYHGMIQPEFPEMRDEYYFGNRNINDVF